MGFDQIVLDRISREAGVSSKQSEATIELLEEQASVPFIARYRKEVTGNLDEVQIRTISGRLHYYRDLLDRRATILKSIEDQNKLTDDLKARILACYEKAELEDLYLPYKPKRRTKASVAIEKGLEPLARVIYEQVPSDQSIEEFAETFVNTEKQVANKEAALEGALHIVAEWISEDAEIRKSVREVFLHEGLIVAKVDKDKAGQKTKYEMYYDFREPVAKIPSHRMLAIRRGVKERILNSTIEIDSEKTSRLVSSRLIKDSQSPFAARLEAAIKDSYERLLNPSLQSEIRALLKERSDAEAIKVFEANLSNLLLSPPAGMIGVMGVDPGYRTGCKVAVVDETGKFLEHTTIFPTEPRKDIAGSERKLYRLIQKHNVRAIAIGNGTGSRETDGFVRDFIRKYQSGEPLGIKPVEQSKEAVAVSADPPTPDSVSGLVSVLEEAPVSQASKADVATVASEAVGITDQAANAVDPPQEVETVSLEAVSAKDTAENTENSQEGLEGGSIAEVQSTANAGAETTPSAVEVSAPSSDAAITSEAKMASEERERHSIFSVIVNESGASVYSASESARREFPKLDLTVRGAISIARRLQDPLAELVKIHPKSIGVGQYQHDVDQKRLKEGLEASVESCVNRVGVDLNTASYELLRYCSGVNQKMAKSIVEYRNQNGKFGSRAQLLQVPGFGGKTFEQAAGFLRIKGGENPLDSTAVHPESYALVEKMATSLGVPVSGLIESSRMVETLELEKFTDQKVGLYTLSDIKQELLKPGRDPRDHFVVPTFREDVKEVSDLKIDMVLEGIVTNVTNFGAFVDIGVHQDGLVHVSELSNRFIHDPREAVHVGEIVKVKVIGVDVAVKRISLSIKALLPQHKKSRPEKASQPGPAQAQKSVQAYAGAGARAKTDRPPSRNAGMKKDQRWAGRPQQAAKAKEMKPKPSLKVQGKAPVKPEPKPAPPKKVEPPSTAPLSFEEKIRLLQQKFGGIR